MVGLGKERPGKTPASNNLSLSVTLSIRWATCHYLLSEGCHCEQFILESALENTLQQIKGNFYRDKSWTLYHKRRK